MKKIRRKFHFFAVSGNAETPERFWSFGFTDRPYPSSPDEYIIKLTRGVSKAEANRRSRGCKLIREIIGDIRGETVGYPVQLEEG